jgi:putative peptide zinc metalloprotease protein
MATDLSSNKGEQGIARSLTGAGDSLSPPDGVGGRGHYKLKEGCEFYPYDGGMGKQEFIIRTPDNRQFKISALSKHILQRLDGTRTLDEVVLELTGEGIDVSADQLRDLLEKQYGKLRVLENSDPHLNRRLQPDNTSSLGLPFFFHWNLIPKAWVARLAARLRFAYSKAAVPPALILIAVSHYLVYFHPTSSAPITGAGALWVLALSLLSILCHEFGHAAAVSRYGGSPGHIGFGLFLLLPSFFADVSEIWRFPRRQRMVVDLGGVYFQELSFVAFALLGYYTSAPEFFAVCYFIDLMAWFNLKPIFRFDGYWLLVDYLAIPNLYRQALGYLWYRVRVGLGLAHTPMHLPPMRRHKYWLFIVYTVACNLFLIAVVWASYRYVSSTLSRLPRVFPEIYHSLLRAVETHDLALFLNQLIALFFVIAFPGTALIGLYKYASQMVRYCAGKVHAYMAGA